MSVIRVLQLAVVVNALLLVLQSIRVIAVYSAIYTLTKGERKQLPLHVWLIATSYLVYTGTTAYYLLTTPAPHALGRTIFYGIAGLIGQYALVNVLRYDRRRLSVATLQAEDE